MAQATALYRVYDLPWTANAGEDQRFKRILGTTAGTLAVLALLVAVLPVPDRDPAADTDVPKRLARLVLERQLPPPPPPVPRVVEELPPPPEPEPVVEERTVPPPQPEPAPVVERRPPPEPVPAPEPAPAVDTVQAARERARSAGLLPFAEQLAALRDNDTASRLDRAAVADVGAGTGAAPAAERNLITSRVGSGSGGINTAALSRDTGGSGLAARATTQVESPVGVPTALGGGNADGGTGGGGASGKATRSREEIERVFDRNKGAIYALYNRALRENPSLQGKLVLSLTIAPDGRVTHCEVVSSELGDPELEQKLVQRVLLFQFEARAVETVTTTKPIDFFPG